MLPLDSVAMMACFLRAWRPSTVSDQPVHAVTAGKGIEILNLTVQSVPCKIEILARLFVPRSAQVRPLGRGEKVIEYL